MRFYITPIGLAKAEKSDNTKCWAGCKEIRTLYIAGKSINLYNHFREWLKIPSEVENMHTLWPNNFIPKSILWEIFPYELGVTYKNVLCNIVWDTSGLEIIQIFIKRKTDSDVITK